MTKQKMQQSLRRNALCVALGMTLASAAFAQNAAGSLFGKADAGATITIQNTDTGTSREIKASADGRFAATQLPTGHYRVTAGAVSRDVLVNVGTGTEVSLAGNGSATNLGRIEVVGKASFNPIDVSSVESTTVFTQEQIRQLPVARDISSVALLAPGTVKGDTGFGNLASFGGASVAENGYYVNGFDVTNIFNFLSYANIPFDAIAQQQVKTGGYGAEYGRSLGGVISLVTKRGTNDWKGGASVYWSPETLASQSANVSSRDPADIASGDKYFRYRKDNRSDELSYNVYGGGPIIKDRLFIFGLIEGNNNQSDTYGFPIAATTSQHQADTQPQGLVKLDWNITDNHLLEFTGISSRNNDRVVRYVNPPNPNNLDAQGNPLPYKYTGQHGIETARYSVKSGGETYIAKYTGHLTDNLTVSAMAGQTEIVTGDRTPALLGSESCPRAYDSRINPGRVVKIGCWNTSATFVRDVTQPPDRDKRNAYRLDVEWRLGDHLIRGGYDHEKFASQRAGQSYTGGIYYRYFKRPNAFRVNGVLLPANTNYVRTWDFRSLSGDFEVLNTAAYIEDSWQVAPNVLLYGGLRGETFKNLNGEGATFAQSDRLLAPRLGFSWDVKGDSTMKVFGNAGRYYIPVAGNTSVRLSGGDNTAVNYYNYSGQIDPVTGAPVGGLGTQIGPNDTSKPVAPDARTVAASNLTPMYQDEFILGLQKDFGNSWTGGVRGIFREVKNGMDDYCGHQSFQTWANDNGYVNADLRRTGEGGTMAQCVLINPGKDVSIALDLQNDGNLTNVTVPASYLGLPKYTRKYRAMEFFFERARADGWYLQGSYTYAKSTGNTEGYVNSTLEQTDAGVTQDFDHALFEDGAYGPLPNDRRHTLKLFGVYDLSDEWRVGGSFLLQSGRPINCNGYIPLGDPRVGIDYTSLKGYSASSFYCRNAQGQDVLGQRGDRGRTPWIYNFDASIGYIPAWASKKLTLEMKVFNIFNIQKVTEYSETSAFGGNTAQQPDPNFLNIVNYQSPRSVLFTARYEF